MRWFLAAPVAAALVAVGLFAAPAPVQADPVVFDGSIFKGQGMGKTWSSVSSKRKGKRGLKSGLGSTGVVYDWNTLTGSLGTGATADFDGSSKKVALSRSMSRMFGKKFGKTHTVTLTLFTGNGNELTVGSEEELAQILSSPTGDLKNAFEIGGKINFSLKLHKLTKKGKAGKIVEQINDTFKINPNKGLNIVGKTDDGIAMFLQGKTKRLSGKCIKRKNTNCDFLYKNFYGRSGFRVNLAMTGSGDVVGGPILDPLEEIEENNDTQNGGGGGGGNGGGTTTDITAVPEPATLGLIALGALTAGFLRRRRIAA
jgi:hypothetical protein